MVQPHILAGCVLSHEQCHMPRPMCKWVMGVVASTTLSVRQCCKDDSSLAHCDHACRIRIEHQECSRARMSCVVMGWRNSLLRRWWRGGGYTGFVEAMEEDGFHSLWCPCGVIKWSMCQIDGWLTDKFCWRLKRAKKMYGDISSHCMFLITVHMFSTLQRSAGARLCIHS